MQLEREENSPGTTDTNHSCSREGTALGKDEFRAFLPSSSAEKIPPASPSPCLTTTPQQQLSKIRASYHHIPLSYSQLQHQQHPSPSLSSYIFLVLIILFLSQLEYLISSPTCNSTGIFSLGNNALGQLGQGDTVKRADYRADPPNPVLNMASLLASVDANCTELSSSIQLRTGLTSSLVLFKKTGTVYGFGSNANKAEGALGDGTDINRWIPVVSGKSEESAIKDKVIVQIETGFRHSLFLDSDGVVYSVGGDYYTLGVLGDGMSQSHTAPVAVNASGVLNGKTIVKISAGANHNLALSSEGDVFCWGSNSNFQCGDGTNNHHVVPASVNATGALSGKKMVDISAGFRHSLVLSASGEVFCFGNNGNGECGNLDLSDDVPVPAAVYSDGDLSGKNVQTIQASRWFSLFLTSDGQLFGCGLNDAGQLGFSSAVTNFFQPVAMDLSMIPSGSTVTSVYGGFAFTLISTDTGLLFGTGGSFIEHEGFVEFNTNGIFVNTVSSGFGQYVLIFGSCVMPNDCNSPHGQYICDNVCRCECSSGYIGDKCEIPLCFAYPANHNDTCSQHGTCVDYNTCECFSGYSGLDCSGEADVNCPSEFNMYSVGWGAWGQLGQGNHMGQYHARSSPPNTVRNMTALLHSLKSNCTSLTSSIELRTGRYHSIVLFKETGTVYSFGANNHGALGTGDQSSPDKTSPVVCGNSDDSAIKDKFIVQAEAGLFHSLFLDSLGNVFSVGHGARGALGTGSDETHFAPVAVNTTSGILDGKIIVKVSAGGHHNLALSSEGEVFCWGMNTAGQCGDGMISSSHFTPTSVDMTGTLSGNAVFDISAGSYHSLVLTKYGEAFCFGLNGNGECGDLSNTNNLVPVAVYSSGSLREKSIKQIRGSLYFSLFLTFDGLVYGCGLNDAGQLGFSSEVPSFQPILMDTSVLPTESTVASVYGGYDFSLIFTDDGLLFGTGGTVVKHGGLVQLNTNGLQVELLSHGFGKHVLILGSDSIMQNCSSPQGNFICNDPTCECECLPGYTEEDCSIPICFSFPANDNATCSQHGKCVDFNTCECSSQFVGIDCSTPFTCFGIPVNETDSVCSAHGDCVDHDQCACDSFYGGDDCSSYTCFGLHPDDYYVCSSHGRCISPQACTCFDGYSGVDCSIFSCGGVLSNDSSVCSGNGDCDSIDSCSCYEGYVGEYCSDFLCGGVSSSDANVCNGHGYCMQSNRICNCSSGYQGEYCSSTTCFGLGARDPEVCSSHGICSAMDQCDCMENYYGSQCSNYSCFGMAAHLVESCSSHGECSGHDRCDCVPGYSGNNCSTPVCFGHVGEEACSSHGRCSVPDLCLCEPGYTFPDCSRVVCFGLTDNVFSVCSSHGTCESPDVCSCEEGFSGETCEQYPCFLFNAVDPLSCHGHGHCYSANNCTCEVGYFGKECENASCFSLFAEDRCSGHGACTSKDNCECAFGYTGRDCSVPKCFGLSNLSSTPPCNGYTCTAPDTCSCHIGKEYVYEDCSVPICFGESHPSLTCSGHGICAYPDTCICHDGFEGTSCEQRSDFLLPFGEEYGDSFMRDVEQINSGTIHLETDKFRMFGSLQSTMRISSNGYVTFGGLLNDQPELFSFASASETLILLGYTLNDLSVSLNNSNTIFYRQIHKAKYSPLFSHHNSEHLALISKFVQQEYYLDSTLWNFNATWCFIITLNEVGYYPRAADKLNSVQAILTVDEVRELSMVIFQFKKIEHPADHGLFGLTSGFSSAHVNIMDSLASRSVAHLTNSSNIANPGIFAYVTSTSALNSNPDAHVFSCFGVQSNDSSSVCSGRGRCIKKDVCQCDAYTKGVECEISCISSDQWAPSVNCDKPKCFNITWDNSLVCSGHGNCISPDQCACDEFFFGQDCRSFNCYGISDSSLDVCSGHGICISTDSCECFDGWTHNSSSNAQDCNVFTCNGKPSSNPEACQNGGVCVAPNLCVNCTEPFFGKSCVEAYRYVDRVHGNDSSSNDCLFRNRPCKSLRKVFQHLSTNNRIFLMGGTYEFPPFTLYLESSVSFIGEENTVITSAPNQPFNSVPLVVNLQRDVLVQFTNLSLVNISSKAIVQFYYGTNSSLHLENVSFVRGSKFLDYQGDGSVKVNMSSVFVSHATDSLLHINAMHQLPFEEQYVLLNRVTVENSLLSHSLVNVSRVSLIKMQHFSVSDCFFQGEAALISAETVEVVSILHSHCNRISSASSLVSLRHGQNFYFQYVHISNALTNNSVVTLLDFDTMILSDSTVCNISSSVSSVAHIFNVSSVSVSKCSFNNLQSNLEGGLSMMQVSKIRLENCFVYNTASLYGSFLYGQQVDSVTIQNLSVIQELNVTPQSIDDTEYLSGSRSSIFLHSDHESEFSMENCSFEGGATSVFTHGSFQIHFSNCSFGNNTGGAIQVSDNSSPLVTLVQCSFFRNHNSDGFGGALSLVGVASLISIVYCDFSEHSAVNGGAIFALEVDRILFLNSTIENGNATDSGGGLYIDAANAFEAHFSSFALNTAQNGGAIFLKKVLKTQLLFRYEGSKITSCTFNKNEAYLGGALHFSNENILSMEKTHFVQNHALRGGGAVYVEGHTIRNEVNLLESTATLSKAQTGFVIRDSVFEANYATQMGGAISFFSSGILFELSFCTFFDNFAAFDGGTLFVFVHSGEISNSRMKGSHAKRGSILYGFLVSSADSGLRLSNVSMTQSYSTQGTVYLSPSVHIVMDHCTMSHCSTKEGNVYSAGSTLDVTDCYFFNNSAAERGGVLYLAPSSILRCGICKFENNNSSNGGVGYIATSKMVSIWNITSKNNSAEIGGSFYFEQLKHTNATTNQFQWHLSNSFLQDRASIAGGSFFLSLDGRVPKPEFFDSSVSVLSSCDGFGPIQASSPHSFSISQLEQTVVRDSNSSMEFNDGIVAFSGSVVDMKLEVTDIYRQQIPFYPGLIVKVGGSNMQLVGELQQILENRQVTYQNLNIFGIEGETGTISFSTEGVSYSIKSPTVEVQFIPCPPGYRIEKGEEFDQCILCPKGSYSLMSSSPVCHSNCIGFTCHGAYDIEYHTGHWIEALSNGELRAVPCLGGSCTGGSFAFAAEGTVLPFATEVPTEHVAEHAILLRQKASAFQINTSYGHRYIGSKCSGNKKGVLCAQCTENHEMSPMHKCVPCTGSNYVIIAIHSIHMLFLLAYIHYSSQNEASGAAVKIIISFMQTVMLIVDVKKLTWDEFSFLSSVAGFLRSVFEFSEPSFGGGSDDTGGILDSCPFPRPGYWLYGYELLRFASQLVILACCALIVPCCCCQCCCARKQTSTETNRLTMRANDSTAFTTFDDIFFEKGGLTHAKDNVNMSSRIRRALIHGLHKYLRFESFVRTGINFIIYNFQPLSNLTMNFLLGCFSLENGEHVMIQNTGLSCWTSTDYWLWALCFTPILLLILLGPSLAVCFLRANKSNLQKPTFKRFFVTLYDIYKPEYYWFEWWNLMRRFLLIVITIASQMLAISYGVNGVHYCLYSIVVAISYILVLCFNPYKQDQDNKIEKLSLFFCLLIICIQEGTSDYSQSVGIMTGIALIACFLLTVMIWLVCDSSLFLRITTKVQTKIFGVRKSLHRRIIVPVEVPCRQVRDEIPRRTYDRYFSKYRFVEESDAYVNSDGETLVEDEVPFRKPFENSSMDSSKAVHVHAMG